MDRVRRIPAVDKFRRFLGRIPFVIKLFAGILAVLLLTLLVVTWSYYQTMSERLVFQHSQDMWMRTIQTNTIIDLQLARIVDSSEAVLQERDVIKALQGLDPANEYEVIQANREVQRVLGKYFNISEWVYAYNIMSHSVKLGQGYVPFETLFDSPLGQDIVEANGRVVWYPTFDFAEMFSVDSLRGLNTDFRYLFAAGRVFRGIDKSGDLAQVVDLGDTYLLVICIREEFLRNAYADLLLDGSSVAIFDGAGSMISASGSEAVDFYQHAPWLADIITAKSGPQVVEHYGRKVILCYDTSPVTGWTLVKATDVKGLLAGASSGLFSSVFRFFGPLALISLSLAASISLAITRPMRQLFRAIKRTGEGDFVSKVPVEGYGDFHRLIEQFNDMNDRIAHLIDENYRVKLHEKKAQLDALNAQLNPHFMYNTLNLINCMAIEQNAEEISRVVCALSRILRYAVDNQESYALVRQELDWLDNYVYIMACRFEDQLDYTCEVDERLLDERVSRFLLQPFVENAFVHGFMDKQEGCRLTVRGFFDDGWRCFSISDNGRGMDSEKLELLLQDGGDAVGIRNAYQRMRLMYNGDCELKITSAPEEGTTVSIRIPPDEHMVRLTQE